MILKHFLERLIENPTAKLIISTAGSILTFLVGGFGKVLSSFVVLLFIDLVTGIAKAHIKEERTSSYISRTQGGKKIIVYMVIIMFANLLDQAGMKGIRSFVILWAAATEGISIAENLNVLGFPLPAFITEKLLQTKEKKFGGF